MRPHIVCGSDSIAILSFLAEFKDACNISRVPEPSTVCCFQFRTKEQAESFLLSRGTGSLRAEGFKRSELLRTYENVVSFLLQSRATDEVIAEAYNDIVKSCQNSAMREKTYYRTLRDKVFRCGIVFSDRRWKLLFIDGVLQCRRAQARQLLSLSPRAD